MKIFLVSIFILIIAVNHDAYADDKSLIEKGLALKAMAERDDANAMMQLAELLIKNAPEPKRPYKICDGKLVNPLIKTDIRGKGCKTVHDKENQRLVELWKPVGNKFTASQWITRAAQAGNRKAISLKCALKDDLRAPASTREEAELWCKKL